MKQGRIFNLIGILFIFVSLIPSSGFLSTLIIFIVFLPLAFGVFGYRKGDKQLGIVVMLLGIILIILLLMGTVFAPEQPPNPIIEQERSLEEVCVTLRNSFNCDISKWSEITAKYKGKDYSLKELCELRAWKTQQECSLRCGCS